MGHPGLPDLGHAVDIPIKYTHNSHRAERALSSSPVAAELASEELRPLARLSSSAPLHWVGDCHARGRGGDPFGSAGYFMGLQNMPVLFGERRLLAAVRIEGFCTPTRIKNMVASRPPGALKSKIERTPSLTPGVSSRSKEKKIFVTVRVRPLSKKELAVKDQPAWEYADSQTIVYKGPHQDRAAPTSYTFATIFAYGQTSSGKTYTMRGVTESAVSDIYRHMENTPEREFVIKISAMEIYNEIVKDLLQPDSGSLRLLDDPEKGPIVEKLDEQVVRDREHLRHLIGICEEQRQVGETALNDTSSRSHQIIRLTVESRLREVSGCVKSFVASLNLVDLAGSERVAQTHAIGARLKEGCHINRSLLTLTKVIRKLSSEKRSGHIPYRDSKLTRILQLSLGGNARTAIICTMSPALTHVEQSRNTLFFATCAKEVTNTAKVNMVISDKQLVKHLQTEVARLEAELRTPDRAGSSEILIMEKDEKIRQLQQQLEVEANRAIEVLHKEVECHKHGNQGVAETIAKLQAEIREMQSVRPENRDVEMITDEGNGSDLKDEISRLHMQDNDIAKLEAKLENVQRSIDKLVMSLPNVGQLSCPPFTTGSL
ncbi:hypothetical protein QYE76_061719 [Lolium multiflorum]|uniref:Kinesin-like protein n=1 Tax=Lolium multiflorum TaxID=4521 RepID=A0AAD8S260_LOLMU|nr:hypothetical protein QYE76_061719 [Lolium multiflorum]